MLERRLLQIAVALAGLVPVAAGALGALRPELLIAGPAHALTHGAYLSGLLLGLGLVFWSLIPTIEDQGRVFGLLTLLVVAGRAGAGFHGVPPGGVEPVGGTAAGHGIGCHASALAVAAPGLFPFAARMTIFPGRNTGNLQTWH